MSFCSCISLTYSYIWGYRRYDTPLSFSFFIPYVQNKMQGKIKNLREGYGFIEIAPGNDVFFHASELKWVEFNSLRQDQMLSFDVVPSKKDPSKNNAVNVTLAEGEMDMAA